MKTLIAIFSESLLHKFIPTLTSKFKNLFRHKLQCYRSSNN